MELLKNNNEDFVFNALQRLIKDFSNCYICDDKLDKNSIRIVRLSTHSSPICLCKKCYRKFKSQREIHERIFLNDIDRTKIMNNEIEVLPYIEEQLIKIAFAHKIWLDKQRRINKLKDIDNANKNK